MSFDLAFEASTFYLLPTLIFGGYFGNDSIFCVTTLVTQTAEDCAELGKDIAYASVYK